MRNLSSGEHDAETSHFLHLEPEDVQFLVDTRIQRKRLRKVRSGDDTTLWNYLSTYKQDYNEKVVLVDRTQAAKIADAIERTSEMGEGTVFIDADGGFFRVAEELVAKRKLFDRCKLFERDVNLKPVRERALSSYLKDADAEWSQVNLCRFPAKHMLNFGDYVSGLYEETLTIPARGWDDPVPNYTLFGTATHGFLKFLTQRCVMRHTFRLSEFVHGRPEFYFIISPRTWFNVSLMNKVHECSGNVLFGLMFHMELVETLDRKSFAPWKKHHRSTSALGKTYTELETQFLFLIRVRPKIDVGLENENNDSLAHLKYFVDSLYRVRRHRLIPVLDGWNAGAALECVKRGYPVHMTISDIDIPSQLLDVFNILTRQPDFNVCSFVINHSSQVTAAAAATATDIEFASEDIKRSYLSMRRELNHKKRLNQGQHDS